MEIYAPALMRGASLPADDAADIATQVARWTGTSVEFLMNNDLRIDLMRYLKELLRDRRRTVGRLDSRFTGIDRDAGGAGPDFDPSMAAITGPFTATFNDYVRRDLGFERDRVYEILSIDVNRAWSYREFENRYVYVGETLREAMSMNPHLRVHVASGIYDLATPYFATEYTLAQLGLDPDLRGNLDVSTYPAGHMMYLHRPSLVKLKEELAAFIAGPS
jgi:carboxypeptidase C (cathepsin A)